ncbi:MAG TPA: molybdopterin-dependent oxidoreductase, partial [Candidatus Acidoferrales bacterium]
MVYINNRALSRRDWLKLAATGGVASLAHLAAWTPAAWAQDPAPMRPMPPFTGPGANPHWNSIGPVVTYPQKQPLILLTDRPPQLETPRHLFTSAITPNSAFYVRWHLDEIPNAIDLRTWRLRVEGHVTRPQSFSLAQLLDKFAPTSVVAVNQCSGNSRSLFQPRVQGGQWGHGAMGCAEWTGVRLTDLLAAAGVKPGAVAVQFEGLDRGKGPAGLGSHIFLKSLDAAGPALERTIISYAMNGKPLPMLNGFPARVVAPGWFATYWTKALSVIRVLDKPDESFWMKSAYRIPRTPRGHTTPDDIKTGRVVTGPIHVMPVRSFLISPDGSAALPARLPVVLRGIAFSGTGPVVKVEVS